MVKSPCFSPPEFSKPAFRITLATLGWCGHQANRRKIGIWKGMETIGFSWDVNNVTRIWGYFGMGIEFWDAGI